MKTDRLVEILTEVTVGQPLEQTGLLAAGGTADGGGEFDDVGLGDLERHLAAAAHRELRSLARLTR